MTAIDWSQPIEAVHDDGRVCPATKVYGETSWRCDGHWWHSNRIDGSTGFDGWRIRNVVQPAAEAPTAPIPSEVGQPDLETLYGLLRRFQFYFAGVSPRGVTSITVGGQLLRDLEDTLVLLPEPVDVDEELASRIAMENAPNTFLADTCGLAAWVLKGVKAGRAPAAGDCPD